MDNRSYAEERDDELMELPRPDNQDRRKNQRSSDESETSSKKSSSSRDSRYVSGDSRSNFKGKSQPTLQEAALYLYGLQGSPRLVARTSKNPFIRAYDGTYPRPKRVSTIGNHPLCAIYNQEVRESIWNALKSVPWITIDISRIGYSWGNSVDPVVMLVTIKAGSTPWEIAQEAINTCQKIIRQKGCEIEVEMREGTQLTAFVGNIDGRSKLLKDPYQRIPDIGQSIGIRDEGQMTLGAGTLTAYVKIHGGTLGGGTYGLTCHHVVFPKCSPSPAGEGNTFESINHPRQFIFQPATLDHDLLSQNLQYQRGSAERKIATLLTREKAVKEGMAKPLSQYQEQQIKKCQIIIAESKNWEEANNKFNKDFGFVVVSSGVSINRANNNLRDWALIELNQSRFNKRPLNNVSF